MTRDWWWPWWVSTAIDLGVAGIAAGVFLAASRRWVRRAAAALFVAAIGAAGLAPVVMKEPAPEMPATPMEPSMTQMEP